MKKCEKAANGFGHEARLQSIEEVNAEAGELGVLEGQETQVREIAEAGDFENDEDAVAQSNGLVVAVHAQVQEPEKDLVQSPEEEGSPRLQLLDLLCGPAAQAEVCAG